MVQKTILKCSDIENILLNYNIGKVNEFSLIKKGCVHSNYILITSKGKFILRVYEQRTNDEINLEMKLLEKLSNFDILIPRNILSNKKTNFIEYLNKRVALFTFMEGEHIEDKNASIEQIQSLGINMGKFHKALLGFKPKEVKKKYVYNRKFVLEILEEIQEDYNDFPKEYKDYILNLLNSIEIPVDLPQGLNHADMHGDNVLFKGNNVSGILDFDDCFYGYFILDIGSIIGYWCIEDEIDFFKCKTFIKNYEKNRIISNVEKKYLYEGVQLFMLIHLIFWLWDKKNWKSNIKPFKVLNCLNKIGKNKFYEEITK